MRTISAADWRQSNDLLEGFRVIGRTMVAKPGYLTLSRQPRKRHSRFRGRWLWAVLGVVVLMGAVAWLVLRP